MSFNGNKTGMQIRIGIILNKGNILTFKHFPVNKNINAIDAGRNQVCPVKLANIYPD